MPTSQFEKAYEAALRAAKKRRPKRRSKEPPQDKLVLAAEAVSIGKAPELSHSADELLLYLDNDEPTYRVTQSIQKNLLQKLRSGRYDHKKAPQAWLYAADRGSERYNAEIGKEGIEHEDRGRGGHAFSPAVRREVAAYMAGRFIVEVRRGEHS